jgi:FkbM family methyltransferase
VSLAPLQDAEPLANNVNMAEPNPIDFSQYGQPDLIRKYLPASASRWVIDVGAHDGVDGSNSRGFILEGWKALLIEPLPAVFDQLRVNTAGFRNVILEQCACAEIEGDATFHIGLDGPDGQTSSLCEDEVWIANRSGEDIKVQVQRLDSLLKKHNCPADFALLLVDAEGMDLEVLKSLDFSHYRPAVICTEIYQSNPLKEKSKAEFLAAGGYRRRVRVGSDTIWSRVDMEPNSDASAGMDLYTGDQLPPEVADLPIESGGVVALNPAISIDGLLRVAGWAISPEHAVPGLVFVGMKTEGGMKWQQSARCVRSDVARHFANQGLRFSGFGVNFSNVVESPVEVRIVQVQGNSRWDFSESVQWTEG